MTAELEGRLYDAAGNWVLVVDGRGDEPRGRALIHSLLEEGPGPSAPGPRPDILCLLTGAGMARVELWNPDGSAELMCGNALRCLPLELALPVGAACRVTTGHGPMKVRRDALERTSLFFRTAAIVLRPVAADEVFVDLGTPHLVTVRDDLDAPEIAGEGWRIAVERWMNATFISVAPGGGLRARTFERGVGETGSCGTGAIAAHLTALQLGLVGRTDAAGGPTTARVRFRSGRCLEVSGGLEGAAVRLSGDCALVGGHGRRSVAAQGGHRIELGGAPTRDPAR
jgi:diaminopimelate epimerase